jgi:hypothetical protein
MKTTHEKLITSLLALGLVGVSPVGAQSQNNFYSDSFINNSGLIFSSSTDSDVNGNGIQDVGPEADVDQDGFFERFNEAAINESNAGGLDAWLNPIAIDVNGDGVIQTVAYALDLDGDGVVTAGNAQIEDLNGNGIRDGATEPFFTLGEDTDRDGNIDVAEDLDGDNRLDRGEDFDADGRLDLTDEQAIVEQNINEANYQGRGPADVNGNGAIDANPYDFDINGDGQIQTVLYRQDLDGDGRYDNGLERDVNGDFAIATTEDLDGDGRWDRGEDLNGDGQLNDGSGNPGTGALLY